MRKKIGISIQARYGSTRLPGKALLDIIGQSLLSRLYERMSLSNLADVIIIATSHKSQPIVDFARSNNIHCTVGSENDLLERHLQVAIEHDLTALVRVTADNPLTDPAGIDQLISTHLEFNYPIVHNKHQKGYPYGTGAELVGRTILEKWENEFNLPKVRSSVFSATMQPEGKYCGFRLNAPANVTRPGYFLTVDYAQDFEMMTKIYAAFNGRNDMPLESVIAFLDKNPALYGMNQNLHTGFAS